MAAQNDRPGVKPLTLQPAKASFCKTIANRRGQMTGQGANARSALDQAIGGRIRMLRKMRGLSQPELAAAIGLSFQQVQRYETGESSLSVLLMSKVAQALGIAPVNLLEAVLQPAEHGLDAMPRLDTPGASELLKCYLALDPKGRGHVLAIARALAQAETDRPAADTPAQKEL